MKKNYINWKRQSCCSFFEICCPAVVMFLMVSLRGVVDITTVPVDQLLEARQATFPGAVWKWKDETADACGKDSQGQEVYGFGSYGSWNFFETQTTNDAVQDFFQYASYPVLNPTTQENPYSILDDVQGPFYFLPTDCLKINSFQVPQTESNIIAMVGKNSTAQCMMTQYIDLLTKIQLNQKETADRELKILTRNDKAELPSWKIKHFKDKDELFQYVSAENYTFSGGNPGICYGFQTEVDENDAYTLTLYFNDQKMSGGKAMGIPDTRTPAYNPLQTLPNTDGYTYYLSRGYSILHNLAANVILKLETTNENASITMLSAPLPSNYDSNDDFGQIISGVLPLLILLVFIPPVYNMVFMLVKEKESRIKESMRMMGMNDSAYWLSWYVYYTVISTAIVFLAWLVLLINTMKNSNPVLVFIFMFFYAQAIFAQIVAISALFENSKYSGIVGTLIYFGLNMFSFLVQDPNTSKGSKAFWSLIPQVAMGLECQILGGLEQSEVGLNFGNTTETINNYTYVTGLTMMTISFVLFLLLASYLDSVLPRTYGERKKCCFCFTICCKKNREVEPEAFTQEETDRRTSLRERRNTIVDPFEIKYLDKRNYEPVAPEIARLELDDQYLKVADLTKTYPNGFQAVNGINLKMYNGQIFSLLGHNGAGKSTTISMLTGLLSRSTGTAQIFGNDLFQEMNEVRNYMGVCPQHDVLFHLLTPEEHLDIFYELKGGDPARKETEIRSLITDVGVAPDRHKPAGSLSGGNRRKLSVALALCGNSRLVLFDEPTAGMDLSARRSMWDMLKNYRQNRIILLTTHYMDEADVLGDRIGIMAKGKVVCLGSSLFLKNRYGAGYKLTMVKKFKQPNRKIQPYLERVFGKVEKLSEVSQEITFKINYEQAQNFQTFFAQFDDYMSQVDILSYGISMTTLEEVFMKVNEDDEKKEEGKELGSDEFFAQENRDHRGSSINREERARDQIEEEKAESQFGDGSLRATEASQQDPAENLVGKGSLCGSISALMKKRYNLYKRDKCGLVCELIVPVTLVLLGLGLLQIPVLSDPKPIYLDTSAYPSQQRMLYNDEAFVTLDQQTDQIASLDILKNLPDYDSYWALTSTTNTIENDGKLVPKTYDQYYKEVTDQQYIGDAKPYRFGTYQFFKSESTNYNFQVNMFVNATSAMSVPYYSQYIYQAIIKTAKPTADFMTVTSPLPTFFIFESRVSDGQALDFGIITSIALALIPCVIISFIIKEREMQLKHMQVISGVSLPAYWISNLISDMVKTYVPIIIIMLLMAAFQLGYEGSYYLLILYPISIVPFTYVTSSFFTSDVVAQILTLFVHFMVGGIMPLVIYFLQIIPSTANLGDSMRYWFTWIPTFCVGQGVVWSATYESLVVIRNALMDAPKYEKYDLQPVDPNIYSMDNLGFNFMMMIVCAVVYSLLLILIEADIFQMCSKFSIHPVPHPQHDLDLDEDVVAEHTRLQQQTLSKELEIRDENNAPLLDPENLEKSASQMDVVRVFNFRKAYTTMFGRPFLAVERISFGLDYGECFALLGVNGAGKSTTFKSLTRDIVPTDGQISIAGHNVMTNFDEARKLIGYCPQHDAIFPLMTVEEHLQFYSQIKGIPADRREQVIEDAIKQLNLAEHRTKPAGTLSGGNKRKLSVGMAIVGNPPIVLLDEPSAGMDPEARRFMWSVVEKISQRDKKSAVILTTHSMEEAEALSTKMGIMVRGGIFRCFGSSQHIKNKFATGYELEIKIRKTNFNDLEAFRDELGLEGELTSRVDLQHQREILQESDLIDDLILDQLRKDGVGSDLFVEADLNEGSVRFSALLQYLYVQKNGFRFINLLAREFAQVELLEQCGDFYKMRVPREDKTIGYLFGQIESNKKDMNIQEYGVCQTSLEQIFQNFANQSIDEKAAFTFRINPLDQLILVNPDRKSTMLQKRISLVGRKSIKSLPPSEVGSSKRDTQKGAPGSAEGSGHNERLLNNNKE